jgi:hypothetical protein
LGLVLLLFGGFMAFQSWSESRSNDAIAIGGKDYVAEIVDAVSMARGGGTPTYTMKLSWKDGQGSVHHFGPTNISEAFWNRITRNGQLVVRQTPIRVREEEPTARPVLVEDAPEQQWQVRFGMIAGLIMMMFGAGCLFSAAREVSRQR